MKELPNLFLSVKPFYSQLRGLFLFRFWLMDCQNVNESAKMASDLYHEIILVPFMARFVVFAKRHDAMEARLRIFCMTDDKMDKLLENREHFKHVARSVDVEVDMKLSCYYLVGQLAVWQETLNCLCPRFLSYVILTGYNEINTEPVRFQSLIIGQLNGFSLLA